MDLLSRSLYSRRLNPLYPLLKRRSSLLSVKTAIWSCLQNAEGIRKEFPKLRPLLLYLLPKQTLLLKKIRKARLLRLLLQFNLLDSLSFLKQLQILFLIPFHSLLQSLLRKLLRSLPHNLLSRLRLSPLLRQLREDQATLLLILILLWTTDLYLPLKFQNRSRFLLLRRQLQI